MTNRTKWIVGISIAALVVLLVTVYVKGRVDQKAKDAEITRLISENQAFTTVISKNKETITTQEQRIVDLDIAVQANLLDLKALRAKGVKDTQTVIDLRTEVARLNLEAGYVTPPVIIHDPVTLVGDYMKLPQLWFYPTLAFPDKWLKINGVITTKGVTIDSLFSYSEPSIILGYSTGFLKKSKPIIVFSDKNPYNVVKDMSNIVIYKKLPFFQRPWVNKVEGVLFVLGVQWGLKQL